MEKTVIGRSGAHLKKICFGDEKSNDYIVISVDDTTLFDNFANGYKEIIDLADEVDRKVSEIEKIKKDDSDIDYVIAISTENVRFSKEATRIVDDIFGRDTLRKYFSDIYAELPDFVPDADCILDFFEKMLPEMEEAFEKKIEERERLRKKKMSKYTPQDYKRKEE